MFDNLGTNFHQGNLFVSSSYNEIVFKLTNGSQNKRFLHVRRKGSIADFAFLTAFSDLIYLQLAHSDLFLLLVCVLAES